ncbi:DUF3494 domain-containing protein [Patescibacteria group bacterium]|nr:DUF3494 domain-containing protein [Patescibacteria group bacterium]
MSGSVYVYAAQPTVNRGTAENFAILAASTITNTGSSVVNGDVGLSPGNSITGFPPGQINGTQHIADGAAAQAQADLTQAYNDAAGRTPVTTIITELGGATLVPGVYTSADGTFSLTGTLTLNAQGDPNAVFIFKTASTLITAAGSSVVLSNSAQACNVFWQVGSSVTLGSNSTLQGNLLVLTSATLTTGSSVMGRVLARNGAVTLDSSTVTKPTCITSPAPVVAVTATTTATVTATTTPVVIPIATTTTPVVITSVATTTVVVTATTTPVVVPVFTPSFPNTGFSSPSESALSMFLFLATLSFVSSIVFFLNRKLAVIK